LRVAVVLGEFPRLTERFIARELSWLAGSGTELRLLPLRAGDPALYAEEPFSSLRELVQPLPHWTSPAAAAAAAARPLGSLRVLRALRHLPASVLRDPRRTLGALPRLAWGPLIARGAAALGCQILWAHWAGLPGISAAAASWIGGLPLVLSCHAWDIFANRAWLHAQFRTAAAITVCTAAGLRAVLRFASPGSPQPHLVHHGVLMPENPPAPRGPAAGRRPRVLGVGRLVAKKGFADLVAAAACGDFELELMGEGPLRAELSALARARGVDSRLRITGFGGAAALRRAFERSDAICAPSVVAPDGDRDGVPNVLVEASVAGLPLISTATGGLPDLVEHQVTGLVVPAGRPQEIAAAVARLAAEPGLAPGLVAGARGRIRQSFNLEASGRALQEVLRGAAGS
jgi:glycosyltransferase involved in cell wall biosynthesis